VKDEIHNNNNSTRRDLQEEKESGKKGEMGVVRGS